MNPKSRRKSVAGIPIQSSGENMPSLLLLPYNNPWIGGESLSTKVGFNDNMDAIIEFSFSIHETIFSQDSNRSIG